MRTATTPVKWKASASKKLEYETRKNTAVSMTGSVFKLANLVISAFTKPQQLPIRQEPNRIQQKCPKPLTRLSASNLLFMAYISICLCKKGLSNIGILCRSTFWVGLLTTFDFRLLKSKIVGIILESKSSRSRWPPTST